MWWQRSEEPTPRPLCGGGVRTNNYTLSPLYKCVIYRSLFPLYKCVIYRSLFPLYKCVISFVQCVIYRSLFPLYKCVIYRSLSPLYNGLFIARVGYPAPARINSTDDPLCEDQLCRRSTPRGSTLPTILSEAASIYSLPFLYIHFFL
jgi:hypothetical protein